MKALLAVIVMVIIMLGFWMLDWQGKQQALAQAQQQLNEKKKTCDGMKQDVKQIDVLVAENNKLRDDLKQVMESGILPENPNEFVANYLNNISKLVDLIRKQDNDDSFTLMSLTPGAQVNSPAPGAAAKPGGDQKGKKKEDIPEPLKAYPTRTFQMTMKGRYTTVIDFLDRLGRLELQRLVTVDKLSLAPSDDVNKTMQPVLTITIPLTAYLRTGGGQP